MYGIQFCRDYMVEMKFLLDWLMTFRNKLNRQGTIERGLRSGDLVEASGDLISANSCEVDVALCLPF
jgi:hypothetical protein